ncbi:DUF397 domain-containing protein [Streptomyces sp. NPDC002680]|uniref:DUF397 domain-containing protein n=1 Tax=Streptomyces sp. NPDC002680 TaxID=3364659 RepID=UPI00367FBAC8
MEQLLPTEQNVRRSTGNESSTTASGRECLDVAAATTAVHVRDSNDVTAAVLTVSLDAWAGFVESV